MLVLIPPVLQLTDLVHNSHKRGGCLPAAIVMNYWDTHKDRSIHMEDIYYR